MSTAAKLTAEQVENLAREVGDMVIVGYYAHGNKHYVAFKT